MKDFKDFEKHMDNISEDFHLNVEMMTEDELQFDDCQTPTEEFLSIYNHFTKNIVITTLFHYHNWANNIKRFCDFEEVIKNNGTLDKLQSIEEQLISQSSYEYADEFFKDFVKQSEIILMNLLKEYHEWINSD